MAIVIPAYEEEKRIGDVLSELKDCVDEDIIVVDDGSDDRTAQASAEHGVTVLQHRINLGKGAALRTGARYAKQAGYEQVIFMDGDGQHTANMIQTMIDALDKAPFVVGCRSFDENMPFVAWFGNHFFYHVAKLLFGITVRDTQSGFRGVKREVLDDIMWSSNHYAVETEMLVEAARHNVDTATIPIATIYHDETKGTDPLHGIRIVLSMVYWRVTRWS